MATIYATRSENKRVSICWYWLQRKENETGKRLLVTESSEAKTKGYELDFRPIVPLKIEDETTYISIVFVADPQLKSFR